MITFSGLLIALALNSLVAAYPNRIGYWAFDEGSGTNVVDSSGSGNDGTLLNGNSGTRTTGKIGQGLYFSGNPGPASTRVAIPDAPANQLTTGFTFAAWVNPQQSASDTIGGYAYLPILSKQFHVEPVDPAGRIGNGYAFGMVLPGFGVMASNAADGPTGWDTVQAGEDPNMYRNQGSVPLDTWSHIAVTWDGSYIVYYLNGAAIGQLPWYGPEVFNSSATLTIGVNSDVLNRAFHGTIDELQMFDGPLLPSDVASLYASNTVPFLDHGPTSPRTVVVTLSVADGTAYWESSNYQPGTSVGEVLAQTVQSIAASALAVDVSTVSIDSFVSDNTTGLLVITLTVQIPQDIDLIVVTSAALLDTTPLNDVYQLNVPDGVVTLISVSETCDPPAVVFPTFSAPLGTACAGLLDSCQGLYQQWKSAYVNQHCMYRSYQQSLTSDTTIQQLTQYAQRCIALLEAYCDPSDPSYYYAPSP